MQKAILFDLDGTLTDSGEGIINCASLALEHFGLSVPSREEMRVFVGPPLQETFLRFGVSAEKTEEAIRVYRSRYIPIGKFENTPYPGIRELLEGLKAEQPDARLWLTIGGDQLADFRRWKDYRRILLEHGICVFPRRGHDLTALAADLRKENPDYRIRLMEMPLIDVSSTQIREALARGEDPSGLLM